MTLPKVQQSILPNNRNILLGNVTYDDAMHAGANNASGASASLVLLSCWCHASAAGAMLLLILLVVPAAACCVGTGSPWLVGWAFELRRASPPRQAWGPGLF